MMSWFEVQGRRNAARWREDDIEGGRQFIANSPSLGIASATRFNRQSNAFTLTAPLAQINKYMKTAKQAARSWSKDRAHLYLYNRRGGRSLR